MTQQEVSNNDSDLSSDPLLLQGAFGITAELTRNFDGVVELLDDAGHRGKASIAQNAFAEILRAFLLPSNARDISWIQLQLIRDLGCVATFSSREAKFLKTLAWPDLSPAVLSALDMWSVTLTNITTYSDSPGYRLQKLRNLVHRHLVDEPKRREALRLYEEEALGIHQIAAQQYQGVKAIRRFLKDSGIDTQRNKPRRGASQEVAAKSEEMRRLYETETRPSRKRPSPSALPRVPYRGTSA